ncbi:MAG: plasmid pRiA4b ORF-3 family protein [Bacteroidales bacterium]
MAKEIFQVKISLVGSKPNIWRNLLMPSDLLLPDFHKITQTAMGWTNSHLHQFVVGRAVYAEKMEGDDTWDEFEKIDYAEIKVSTVLKKEKDKIKYEYDFGDGWEHDIVLEKILPDDGKIKVALCIKGKMNCPPEDCGGIWGYYDMLEILKQPKHEEYESYIEWLGEEYDPEEFDIVFVNELLQEEDYGCLEL